MRQFKDYLILYFKGTGMGASDVVPGVSGGTIAFITGIYEELIHSIKSVDIQALKMILNGNLKQFWQKINGPFHDLISRSIMISEASTRPKKKGPTNTG
jgi:putative membrane protein